jgi:uncharacterized protein (DUF1330 family)
MRSNTLGLPTALVAGAVLASGGGAAGSALAFSPHPIEGDFGLKRLAILEFPSVGAPPRFCASPEYAPLLKLRQEAARSDIVLVEGWTPPA